MNEQELNLSKLSYIDKDFASIYPDLLDLVKTLTNRWDPSSSNESDPGVVLLKIGAFLADHLNYNIDKNILEAFLPSATQEESVRRITEFGGYVPKYYRSAVGDVSITYNPDGNTNGFTIPEFTLVISNDDNSITYTQLDAIAVSAKNVPFSGRFIEGTVQRLSVDSDIITLNNIDYNNRLYFPNKFVAENGVFIYNVLNGVRSSNRWEKTDYIYTQPVGTKCYKIDYDSTKGLPYIEFPTDISNLIEDGLAVYYIYTSGSYGNVKRGELNTILSVNSANLQGEAIGAFANLDDFIINNSSSITNGCEPESLDEMRRSYRQVVGTFDTLVSTQDYSNAIRTAEDNVGQNYISNGLVTDRRIDYNNALNVVSTKATGTYYKNISLYDFGGISFLGARATKLSDSEGTDGNVYTYTGDGNTYLYTNGAWKEIDNLDINSINTYLNGMSPYDLIIYALQKYSAADYNSLYYAEALKNSFKQIDGTADRADTVLGTEDNLIDALEEFKCINHTFSDLKDGQVYCFKNYVPLNVDIVTYNKVTKYERNEILDNIRRAISDNFNASKLEFGEELNYDEVKKVIEESDPRINYIRMSDFVYTTKAMLKDSRDQLNAAELDLNEDYDGSTFMIDLIAKNVLAGRLCLFNFDDNFNYRYGQESCNVYTNIVSIQTLANLPQEHTLNSNEYVEILYPRYYSDTTYGSYVLYNLTLTKDSEGNAKEIPAGTEYTLSGNDTLTFYYLDQDNKPQTKTYIAGETIKASFTLRDFEADQRPTYNKDPYGKFKQIASNESISTRVLLTTVFDSPTYVYWILNNSSNTLFNINETEHILSDNEFFIYTDSTKKNLTILGRGTKLKRVPYGTATLPDWSIPIAASNKLTRQQLSDEGLASKIPFVLFSQFTNIHLEATEMNIVTLGEDDSYLLQLNNPADTITFNAKDCNNISYTTKNGDTIILPAQTDFYKVRSRLDINCSTSQPMILEENQFITIKYNDGSSEGQTGTTISGTGLVIQSNVDFNLQGNSDTYSLDLSIYGDLGIQINWMTYVSANESDWKIIATSTPISATSGNPDGIWAYQVDSTGKRVYRFLSYPHDPSYDGTWFECNIEESEDKIKYTYELNGPEKITIPFSTVWYEYLQDSEATDLIRQYICEIYLDGVDENETEKIKVSFEDSDGTSIELGHYGLIGEDNSLINNKAIYIYPKVTSSTKSNINLIIDNTAGVSSGMITLLDPKVIWGFNNVSTTLMPDIENHINKLITNSSSPDIQFHWTNIPSQDMAMTVTDMNDTYAMFDHNNVANIFTIPEIDLENSNIEVIRSMRNY